METDDPIIQLLLLSSLPYRRSFYRAGGWSRLPPPGTSDFPGELGKFFPVEQIQQSLALALQILRRYRNLPPLIHFWEPEYPVLLRSIFDPPAVLFFSGDRPDWNGRRLAIVGTRKPDPVARIATGRLVQSLDSDMVVVSGFARGIDRIAHLESLERGMGTIGVLASGVDLAGPVSNLDLPRRARRQGSPFTLLSEFPPGTPAARHHFIRRNRIIAGLCPEVCLIQAPEKSGALITASFALEEGREVLVFDHPLFDANARNAGGRSLIRDGAHQARIHLPPVFGEPEEGVAWSRFTLERLQGRILNLGGGNFIRLEKGGEPSLFPD